MDRPAPVETVGGARGGRRSGPVVATPPRARAVLGLYGPGCACADGGGRSPPDQLPDPAGLNDTPAASEGRRQAGVTTRKPGFGAGAGAWFF